MYKYTAIYSDTFAEMEIIMVNHIVMWNLKDTLADDEKIKAAQNIKSKLEALKGKIDGIIELKVIINENEASSRDIALISSFESQEALDAYQVHEEHIKAGGYVKTVACDRVCFDY